MRWRLGYNRATRPMEPPSIDVLRIAFQQSVIATLVTQLGCYMRLVSHPELQFSDLLDALSRNAVIGDDAAMRLHRRLQLPKHDGPPLVRRDYWEQLLNERSIGLTQPFYAADAPPAAEPATPTV